MKIFFKNRTKYSRDFYDEYLEFHRKKYTLKYTLYTALVVFAILFCIVLQVANHYYSLAIMLCFAMTIFFLWRNLHPTYEVSKDYNSKKIVNENEFTFIFYNKFCKIYGRKEISELNYFKIYRVFETDTFFYIYVDKTHSLLLDKNGFTKGSPDTFSKFIKHKVLWKYNRIKN